MEKHPFKQRGSPITFYFSFSFIFWDLKIVSGCAARQSISFTGNDCYMDTKPFKCLIFRIPLSYVLPPNFKYFVMYRKVKKKNRGGEVKKRAMSLFVHFWFFFWLKPHVKLLACCSVHISEFMTQGWGIVYKMWAFYLQTVSVNMFWPIFFGSLYFAIVWRC